MRGLIHWFEKSSKRKGKLQEYFQFCDQEYTPALKHISVRWLSLEKCVARVLQKFASLQSYFLSEDWADERFKRLKVWLQNPLLEPAFSFQSNAISIFTNFNKILQRDEKSIHLLKPTIENRGRKLGSRVLQAHVLCSRNNSVYEIELDNNLFKHPIFLGMTTRAALNRLLGNGNISPEEFDKVYNAVHHYFRDSFKYIQVQEKFPISHDVISNSVWVDVTQRCEVSWENVQFFLDRYSTLKSFEGRDHGKVYEEFIDYQTYMTMIFQLKPLMMLKSLQAKLKRKGFTIT